jgi:hypothetical protein
MVNKGRLTSFIARARTKTYAGNTGEVEPLLEGSKQFEHKENDWLYRDIYNQGNRKFAGLETVYFKGKPVWSMSYYGNFEKMTEKEADAVLRKALIDKSTKVRLWHSILYEIDQYTYINEGSGSIDESEGSEQVEKNGKPVYYFYYAAGLIG